jgi:Questin oxidase-like
VPQLTEPVTDLVVLLDRSLAFDAEYSGNLSSHLPMLLGALHQLGASNSQLQTAFTRYSAQLQPMPPQEDWALGDPWRVPLGQPRAWPRYRHLFALWLEDEGAGEVLRQTLPVLLQGCGAAAFHGLIRTAYAVQSAHRAELAHALAYWACRWLPLEAVAVVDGLSTDVAAVLARASAVPGVASCPSDMIVDRMHHATQQSGFAAALQPLQLGPDTLGDLARHAAQLYARSGSFTVLHAFTSACALQLLWPFVEDEPDAPGQAQASALAAYWQACAAAVCSLGSRLKVGTAPAPLPWPQLVAAALQSPDEHLVKLVHSCQQAQQVWGDAGAAGGAAAASDWQLAASRAVRDAAKR